MIMPITTCKYNKHKKGEIIKIEKKDKNYLRTKETDKEFYKKTLGTEKPTFTEFAVIIDNQKDAEKLNSFCDYIVEMDKRGCLNCGKNESTFANVRSNDAGGDEILIQCPNCLSNNIDGSIISKDYIKWFNGVILDSYGLNFKDGFPKSIRAEWGTKCSQCGGNHDGAGYYFDFT